MAATISGGGAGSDSTSKMNFRQCSDLDDTLLISCFVEMIDIMLTQVCAFDHGLAAGSFNDKSEFTAALLVTFTVSTEAAVPSLK